MKKRDQKGNEKTTSTAARTIEVKVDRVLARKWKKQLAELQAAGRAGAQEWDRKYEAVGAIVEHDPPLYLAGGVSTDKAFFAKYLPGEKPRTITRNIRVAQYASPDEEVRYGTSAIDAALDYLEATLGKPRRGRIPVDFAKLRIHTSEGSFPFAAADLDQLLAAAREAKRTAAGGPAPRSALERALIGALPRGAKGVTVRQTRGRVSIGNIPEDRLPAVMKALATVKLPRA